MALAFAASGCGYQPEGYANQPRRKHYGRFSVSLVPLSSVPATTSPIPIRVLLGSDAVGHPMGGIKNFDAADVTVIGAAASELSGEGTAYAFNVTPAGAGVFSVFIAAGKILDAGGQANTASNVLSIEFRPP